MRTLIPALTTALALVTVCAPNVTAAPVIAPGSDFVFTENRGPNPAGLSSGWEFVLGSTNITSSDGSTTATETHVPSGSGPDYALSFLPAPQFPNQYAVVTPYTTQTGQWSLVATDGTGSSAPTITHVLDHAMMLPLITGLAASGPLLTPHLTWDAVNPATFPSFCSTPGSPNPIFGTCAVGYQFYNYQVEMRVVTGTPGNPAPLIFSSAALPTSVGGTLDPSIPAFDVPAGKLSLGNTYLFGIRLIDNDLEAILPNGSFSSPLENRSTAYLEYSTVPEPASLMMFATGALMIGLFGVKRTATDRNTDSPR
jgi:PEP-CTERM motif-containing protein